MRTRTVLTARARAAAARAVRRGAESGSGPVPGGGTAAARSGLTSGFATFAEALLVGVVITALSLPLVTVPAALVAGIGHLRRFVNDRGSSFSALWRDFRAALWGGTAVAVAAGLGTAAALFAIGLAAADATPVGKVMSVLGYLGLGIVGVAVLMAAGAWTPDDGWLRAVRGLRDRLDADPVAVLYLFVAVGLTVVLTWQFYLLLVPSLGMVAFAVVAVSSRSRGRAVSGS